MKTLYLIRHAKSSWDDFSLSDFERPLNKRGTEAAPLMGKILSELISPPELVISSPAKRAITTAKIISNYFNIDQSDIVENMKIYEAAVSDIIRIINNTRNTVSSLMLFGHNPAFTLTTNFISDKSLSNLPTAGFVEIQFPFDDWNLVEGNSGKLIRYEYPKKYQK